MECIELMIVIAIIGILAAIAIPSYQNYIKKAAYSEIPLAMSSIRTAVDTCYGIEKDLTKCDSEAEIGEKLPTATNKALNKIELKAATDAKTAKDLITATPNAYKGIEATEICVLTPTPETTAGDRLKWDYSGKCLDNGYVKN